MLNVLPCPKGEGSIVVIREAPMADYDILITGGTIVDGTRTPRYVSDIGIKNGKIAQIGGLRGKTADRVLDAAGRIVAPGFVDLHTHYDAQLFWDPYCTLSGWHGVTSVAIGNCGFGFAPVEPELREYAMRLGMPWDWVSFPQYLDSLDRTPKAINVLPYVPVGPMLVKVLGLADAKSGRLPTEGEHQLLAKM